MTTPEPSHTLVSRRRSGWLVGGLLLMAGVAVAVAVGWGWKGRRIEAAAPPPMVLAREAWESVDREDAAAARAAIRRLRERGATGLAAVVQARLLVARGFSRPALDVLAALPAETDGASDADLTRFSHLVRGEAAYRLRIYPVAEQELKEVLAATPDSVDAHRLLAAMYYDAGVIPAAIEQLEATARLAPTDSRPHRLLGLIHNDYERYPEAIEHYRESLRRAPDQPDRDEVLVELAGSLVKLRSHREALATLEPLSASDAADLIRAECLLAIGDRAAARAIVDRLLRASPDDLGALILDGSVHLEDGDPQGALGPLQRVVARHPRDYLARLKLAQAYAGCGREAEADEARAEAERIRALRREFADLHQEAWAKPADTAVRRRLAAMAAALDRPDLEEVWLEAAAALEAVLKPPQERK
ncbi:MAG: tetratricopeptide repeat protein [Planctomycetota bacterium]|nr:tetratricopeptide repeat protein [Planctomycetota bacterium]